MKGKVYQNVKTGNVYLSLGFRSCSVLGIRLKKVETMTDVACQHASQ